MKRLLLLTLTIALPFFAFTQINYEKTYADALEKSRASKLPLFVYIDPSASPVNFSFESGINNADVIAFYNANFISLKLRRGEPMSNELSAKFKISFFPAYVFIDNNEGLIIKTSKNNITSEYYLNMAKEAISRLESGKTISEFDKKYLYGINGRPFLKEYIGLRIRCDIHDNAKLIEQYVSYLTIGEFENKDEVLFILGAGPFAYGRAYRLAYTNGKMADDAFKALPERERVEINNRIINNTFQESLNTRNRAMAQQAADFTGNTWGNNYKEREKQSTLKMMDYYRIMKDTTQYFQQASYFYDTHYMTISVDSVKRAIAKNQKTLDMIRKFSEKRLTEPKKSPDSIAGKPIVRTVVTRTVTVSANGNDVANTLNTAAWNFYELGTTNNNYLGKALLWSKRSIEIDPLPAYYDTLAHIFYKMGLYDEAILNQNKAIELISDQNLPKIQLTNAKAEAKKMKERTL